MSTSTKVAPKVEKPKAEKPKADKPKVEKPKAVEAKADKPEAKVEESQLVITTETKGDKRASVKNPRIETKDGKRVCLHWAIHDTIAKAKVKYDIAYAAIRLHRKRERIEGKWLEDIAPALKYLSTPEGRKNAVADWKKSQQ